MEKRPTAEQLAKYKSNAKNESFSADVRAKFQSIVDKFENVGEAVVDAVEQKKERKPRTTKTTTKVVATKQTKSDIESAKAEIKKRTGKTEEECESIVEEYRSLRAKSQERKKKEVLATEDNKDRVSKLKKDDKIISGTSEKTADAVIETTTKDVAEKIVKELDKIEQKAEVEATKEVKKEMPKESTTEQNKVIAEKTEEKVKEIVKTKTKRILIDTSDLLTSIAESLGKFDKDSQKLFLIKLRSDIDKLLTKFSLGGATMGATQTFNITQSNMSSSSVNPTMFGGGGGVNRKFMAGGMNELTNGQKNKMYLENLPFELQKKYLENIAKNYGIELEEIKSEVYYDDAELLYEYIADRNLRAIVYVGMESMENKFNGGGGVGEALNTEVILTENKPNGLKFKGIVKPFMLKSIEDNQYSGGFKRYEIDIYDEVDADPTKEDIKKANEFFDKIGGRYSKGGGVGGNRAKSVTHKINGKDRKFPIKDAWRREHNSYNKSEKHEIPLSQRKFVGGGGVHKLLSDKFEEVGYETYARNFGVVQVDGFNNDKDINVLVCATIINMLDATGDEQFEEKPFTISIETHAYPKFWSNEYVDNIKDMVGEDDIDARSLDYLSDANSYGLGVPLSTDADNKQFETEEEAINFLNSKKLNDQISGLGMLSGFHFDKPYNRIGNMGWDLLYEQIGVNKGMKRGGSTYQGGGVDKMMRSRRGMKYNNGGGVSYRGRDNDKIKVGDIVQYANSNTEYQAKVIDIVYDNNAFRKGLSSVKIQWLDNGKIENAFLEDLMLSNKMTNGGGVDSMMRSRRGIKFNDGGYVIGDNSSEFPMYYSENESRFTKDIDSATLFKTKKEAQDFIVSSEWSDWAYVESRN
jgi:hypothetical protein